MPGIKRIANHAGVTKEVAGKVLKAIVSILVTGERVVAPGLGVFSVKEVPERRFNSPVINEGKRTKVPAQKVVLFKCSETAKRRINRKKRPKAHWKCQPCNRTVVFGRPCPGCEAPAPKVEIPDV